MSRKDTVANVVGALNSLAAFAFFLSLLFGSDLVAIKEKLDMLLLWAFILVLCVGSVICAVAWGAFVTTLSRWVWVNLESWRRR